LMSQIVSRFLAIIMEPEVGFRQTLEIHV